MILYSVYCLNLKYFIIILFLLLKEILHYFITPMFHSKLISYLSLEVFFIIFRWHFFLLLQILTSIYLLFKYQFLTLFIQFGRISKNLCHLYLTFFSKFGFIRFLEVLLLAKFQAFIEILIISLIFTLITYYQHCIYTESRDYYGK